MLVAVETAILPARAFGTTAEFWLNLQAYYDLERARMRVTEERVRGVDSYRGNYGRRDAWRQEAGGTPLLHPNGLKFLKYR